MRMGAILGSARPAEEEKVAQYGAIWDGFQIVDDVLDLTASESVLGSRLPAICARASDHGGDPRAGALHPAERAAIETILPRQGFQPASPTSRFSRSEQIRLHRGRHERAAQYAESARKAICTFPIPRSSGRCCGRRILWFCGKSSDASLLALILLNSRASIRVRHSWLF